MAPDRILADLKLDCPCSLTKDGIAFKAKYFDNGVVTAILPLQKYPSYNAYLGACRKVYKGNAVRDMLKAKNLGYSWGQFPYKMHLPDIVEINHSKEMRGGIPMQGHYQQGLDEKGGAPDKEHTLDPIHCLIHWTSWFGVWKSILDYKQGDIRVDKKLLAYTQIKRVGETLWYNMILGHGDYLRDGVMYFLHCELVRFLLEIKNPLMKGVKWLTYAGYYGTPGRMLWKKKMLFEPGVLCTK